MCKQTLNLIRFSEFGNVEKNGETKLETIKQSNKKSHAILASTKFNHRVNNKWGGSYRKITVQSIVSDKASLGSGRPWKKDENRKRKGGSFLVKPQKGELHCCSARKNCIVKRNTFI